MKDDDNYDDLLDLFGPEEDVAPDALTDVSVQLPELPLPLDDLFGLLKESLAQTAPPAPEDNVIAFDPPFRRAADQRAAEKHRRRHAIAAAVGLEYRATGGTFFGFSALSPGWRHNRAFPTMPFHANHWRLCTAARLPAAMVSEPPAAVAGDDSGLRAYAAQYGLQVTRLPMLPSHGGDGVVLIWQRDPDTARAHAVAHAGEAWVRRQPLQGELIDPSGFSDIVPLYRAPAAKGRSRKIRNLIVKAGRQSFKVYCWPKFLGLGLDDFSVEAIRAVVLLTDEGEE